MKKKLTPVAVIAGVLFLTFSCFLYPTWNCDMISGQMQEEEIRREIFSLGRPMIILLYLYRRLLEVMGITYSSHQWVIQLTEILLMTISCLLVYYINIEADVVESRTVWIKSGLVLIGFVNPFYVEVYLFTCPSHGQALLFTSLALVSLRRIFHEDDRIGTMHDQKKVILDQYRENGKGQGLKAIRAGIVSMFFLLLALSTYQSYYAVFMVYGLAHIYTRYPGFQNAKRRYSGYWIVLGVTFLATVGNLVLTRYLAGIYRVSTGRAVAMPGSAGELLYRFLRPLLSYGKAGVFSYYTIPPGVFVIMALTAIVLIFVSGGERRRDRGLLAEKLILLIVIWMAPIAYAFAAQSYTAFPRILATMFFSLSSTWLIAWRDIQDHNSSDNRRRLFILSPIIFLIICIIGIHITTMKVVKTNGLELAAVYGIHDVIKAYEKESGQQVETLAVYKLGGAARVFKKANDTIPIGGVQSELLAPNWSDVASINYFCDTAWKRRAMSEEEYHSYFPDLTPADFTRFDLNKQIHIEGDTAYWVTYAWE